MTHAPCSPSNDTSSSPLSRALLAFPVGAGASSLLLQITRLKRRTSLPACENVNTHVHTPSSFPEGVGHGYVGG